MLCEMFIHINSELIFINKRNQWGNDWYLLTGVLKKFVLTLNVLSEPKAKCILRIGLQNCIPKLEGKINICLKEMDVNLVQSIAGSVQKRLDTVHRKGYDAL